MAPTNLAIFGQQGSVGCSTPACLALSKTLVSNANFNIDPCSDFFQFTCGGWLHTEPVKDKTTTYDLMAQTEENSLQKIISFLNGTFEDLSKKIHTDDASYHTQDEQAIDKKNFELVQGYYNLCIDKKARSKVGVTPIYKTIANIEHNLLPYADEIDPKKLAAALITSAYQEIPSLMDFVVTVNPLDHTQYILAMSSPTLDKDVDYTSIESLSAYKDTLIGLLNLVLGGPSSEDSDEGKLALEESKKVNFNFWSTSKIKLAVSRFIDFQVQLSSLAIDETDFEKHVPVLHELKEKSKLIDWDFFISTAARTNKILTPNLPVAFTIGQVELLESILSKTSVKTLQEYFVIQTVKYRLDSLFTNGDDSSEPVKDPKIIFQAPTPIEPVSHTLQTACGAETSANFKNIVGRFFALSTFGASAEKKQAEEYVDLIHSTWLNDLLPKTDWAGKESLKNVIEKVGALKKKVAYSTTSPDWRTPSALEQYYKGYTLDSNYYDTFHGFSNWKIGKSWNRLPFPVDAREWASDGYPEQFNAQYSVRENSIEIPIGILQSPFYNPGFPQYINFGALGSIIGHELTHSLDNRGRLYNKDGYLGSVFTKEDSDRYEEKTKCFVKQFDDFTLLGPDNKPIHVHGESVLSENIADSGGMRIAYNAYLNYIKKTGVPEKPLPGFEKYTPEQLFFIGKAQFTCAMVSKDDAQHAIDKDVHAPLYYRNIGAFQNSAEFAKAFNCPVGSPMNPNPPNPEKKCSIW